MRRTLIFVASLAVLLAVVRMADSQQNAAEKPADTPAGVLGVLQVGQQVLLDRTGDSDRYSIAVNPMGYVPESLYKILEVQRDYLVVETADHTAEIRVPLGAIRSVVVRKTGTQEPAQ